MVRSLGSRRTPTPGRYPYKREIWAPDEHPVDMRQRDEAEAFTNQGTPKVAATHQQLGEGPWGLSGLVLLDTDIEAKNCIRPTVRWKK